MIRAFAEQLHNLDQLRFYADRVGEVRRSQFRLESKTEHKRPRNDTPERQRSLSKRSRRGSQPRRGGFSGSSQKRKCGDTASEAQKCSRVHSLTPEICRNGHVLGPYQTNEDGYICSGCSQVFQKRMTCWPVASPGQGANISVSYTHLTLPTKA